MTKVLLTRPDGTCYPSEIEIDEIGGESYLAQEGGPGQRVTAGASFTVRGWGDLDGQAREVLADGRLIGYMPCCV